MTQPITPRLARWAPIPLRLIVGFGFTQHGFAKLGRGPEHFANILQALGTPLPISWHGSPSSPKSSAA